MEKWTAQNMPNQSGRVFVVTGANTGLGLQATKALAQRGARVVMACRSLDKAQAARSSLPPDDQSRVEVERLDLGSLAGVRQFASALSGTGVAVLINNAGVMYPPASRTEDGHEMQWGTNVLGHFLLTGLLLPQVSDRVVWLTSLAHRHGEIDFDDPDSERKPYEPNPTYAQSKLANLMLAYELQRRLSAAQSAVRSVAAHPGYATTELQTRSGTGLRGRWTSLLMKVPGLAQPADMGALPELYAATMPDVPGGSLVGPDGPKETKGHPTIVESSPASHDQAVAKRLWELCEQQTGFAVNL